MEREAAIARLRVIGNRALARLRPLIASGANPAVRAAALRALEGVDDPRALDSAMAAVGDADAGVATAAVGVLRGWLTREPGTRALEALTDLALDRGRDDRVRLAALDALADLPRELVQPVLDAWGQTPVTGRTGVRPPYTATQGWRGCDDPRIVRDWLSRHAGDAPLSELHDLIMRSSERARGEASAAGRAEWLTMRGAGHAALARRGSRVALYDLRDAFDAAAAPLPLDFLTAVTVIGDASCLEPLARAWAASPHEIWWREHLVSAANEIVHRLRLSGRSRVVKRLRAKFPGFV